MRSPGIRGGVEGGLTGGGEERVEISTLTSSAVPVEVGSLVSDDLEDGKSVKVVGKGTETPVGSSGLAREDAYGVKVPLVSTHIEGGKGNVVTPNGTNPVDESDRLSMFMTMDSLTAKKKERVFVTEAIIKSSSSARGKDTLVRETAEDVATKISPQFKNLVLRRNGYEELLLSLDEANSASRKESLESIMTELSLIENASEEARALQSHAISATKKIMNDSEESRLTTTEMSKSKIQADLEEMSRKNKRDLLAAKARKLEDLLASAQKDSEQARLDLYSLDSWSEAGYSIDTVLDAEKSLSAIGNVPLHTYLLRDDSKGDVMVHSNFNQRRTRRHVGVIDSEGASTWLPESDDSGSIDASTVFAYNLKALSQLALEIDLLVAAVEVLTSSPRKHNATLRLNGVAEIISPKEEELAGDEIGESQPESSYKWKSSAQLAAETSALESEASLAEMELLTNTFKSNIKMVISQTKHYGRLSLLDETDISTARSVEAAKVIENQRETDILRAEAELDITLNEIATIGKIISMKKDTLRELLRLKEASFGESERARARILSEAEIERDTESASIQRIRVIGEEATKATIEIIKVAFMNVAGALEHTFKTSQGQKQLALFICGSCALAFCIVLIRELSGLLFLLVRKSLMTPKLVREFGQPCKRQRSSVFRDENIVLTKDVEERMNRICSGVALARARGAPLRHVLIYGRPGTGKSAMARAMGKGILGLPYALMSGSDLAPLGKHGPDELRKLLTWAQGQKRGALLIIDEAEAALGRRLRASGDTGTESASSQDSTSEGGGHARDALNVLLSMTGSASCHLMLVLTTSNPEALDEAVLDRMDELVELALPSRRERRRILSNSFDRRFRTASASSATAKISVPKLFSWGIFGQDGDSRVEVEHNFKIKAALDDLSSDAMTGGCSGRELDKMLQSVVTGVYGDFKGNGRLGTSLWNSITSVYCQDLKRKWDLLTPNIPSLLLDK